MKFALVNGQRSDAAKTGLRGTCVYCQSDTIAKCGLERIDHWAHKIKSSCDQWWEEETAWHRAWKNRFPAEWQESIHIDSANGEKHIADIKTDKEFVIEFQHSAIKPDEIKSREAFYRNMVWVVDGTRLKRDYPRFRKGFRSLITSSEKGLLYSAYPEDCFPLSWLRSSVPVYFDFAGEPPLPDGMRDPLCCLFPCKIGQSRVVGRLSREKFIERTLTNPHSLGAKEGISRLVKQHQQRVEEAKMVEAMRAKAAHLAFERRWSQGRI